MTFGPHSPSCGPKASKWRVTSPNKGGACLQQSAFQTARSSRSTSPGTHRPCSLEQAHSSADSPALTSASVVSSENPTMPSGGCWSGSIAISRMGRLSILRSEPGPVPGWRRRIYSLRVSLLELVIAQVRHRAAASVLAEHQAPAKLEGERPVRHLRRAVLVDPVGQPAQPLPRLAPRNHDQLTPLG